MHLSIHSFQTVDGATEGFVSEAEATMRQIGDTLYLTYEESLQGVTQPVKSMIKWNATDHQITMIRKGQVNTTLIFEEGKTRECEYQSGFGTLKIGVHTRYYRAFWDGLHGQIELRYDLLCGGSMVSENQIQIDISETKTK